MSTYREAGRPLETEAPKATTPDERPRVNRRELAVALLPFIAWIAMQLVYGWYFGVLGKVVLGWTAYVACGWLITNVGLAIQTFYYKRKPDFGRDLLAQETATFLKEVEEAEARELRKRVFLVPARVAPLEGATVAEDVEANESEPRGVGKAEPW